MKKISLLAFTLLMGANVFANKVYTIYYHDPNNRGRKIWVWNTGIDDYDNKSDDSHNKLKNSTRSDDHYSIFELKAKDNATPGLDFVQPQSSDNNTPNWDTKDKAIRENIKKGDTDGDIILNSKGENYYFFADKQIYLDHDIYAEIKNLSKEQKDHYYKEIEKKNHNNEIESLEKEIKDLKTEIKKFIGDYDELEKEANKLDNQDIKDLYNSRLVEIKKVVDSKTEVADIKKEEKYFEDLIKNVPKVKKVLDKIEKNKELITNDAYNSYISELKYRINNNDIDDYEKTIFDKTLENRKSRKILADAKHLSNKEVNKFYEKLSGVDETDKLMKINKQIKTLDGLIDKFKKIEATIKDKEKGKEKELIKKVNDTIDSSMEIEEAIKCLTEIIHKLTNPKDFTEYADAFYYKNSNVFNSLNENIFFSFNLDSSAKDLKNIFSKLTLGGTYRVSKIKVGGFVQYDKQKSHNFALGTSISYDNFDSFVRYRLALYNKVLNHNIDIYAKYAYTFTFNKLKVSPHTSIYTTISAKTKINDEIALKTRFGIDLNLGTKLSYDILDNLSIFTNPTFTVSYNDQKLENVYTNEQHKVSRSYFDYHLNLGLEYKTKGFTVSPVIKLSGDIIKDFRFGTDIYMSYNFN